MSAKIVFILLGCFLIAADAQDTCATMTCGECQECRMNSENQPKCVYMDNCCPVGEPVVRCLLDPCSNADFLCPHSAHCVSLYCKTCTAKYYDSKWNEVTCSRAPEDPCSQVRCNTCEECQVNSQGQPKCVYKDNCCPAGRPTTCPYDVCANMYANCPGSTMCVPMNCDGGCAATFYDLLLNEMPTCSQHLPVGPTPVGSVPPVPTPVRLPADQCSTMQCPECHECMMNSAGQPKCVYRENCCPAGQPTVPCPTSPCTSVANSCPESRTCVTRPCGTCTAKYYDMYYNEITTCPTGPVPSQPPTATTTTKAGVCPTPTTGLGTCNQDCSTDQECPGSQKCCSTGCGHVCSNPLKNPTTSFDQCLPTSCGPCEVCTGGQCVSRRINCVAGYDPCTRARCPAYPTARCTQHECNCYQFRFLTPDGADVTSVCYKQN